MNESSVVRRALQALKEKEESELAIQLRKQADMAAQKAELLQQVSVPFVADLQSGEFADPEWKPTDIIYQNGDLTQMVIGVVFSHSSPVVPKVVVDKKGRVFEARRGEPGIPPWGWMIATPRSPWLIRGPLTLLKFGMTIRNNQVEYDELMSRD